MELTVPCTVPNSNSGLDNSGPIQSCQLVVTSC